MSEPDAPPPPRASLAATLLRAGLRMGVAAIPVLAFVLLDRSLGDVGFVGLLPLTLVGLPLAFVTFIEDAAVSRPPSGARDALCAMGAALLAALGIGAIVAASALADATLRPGSQALALDGLAGVRSRAALLVLPAPIAVGIAAQSVAWIRGSGVILQLASGVLAGLATLALALGVAMTATDALAMVPPAWVAISWSGCLVAVGLLVATATGAADHLARMIRS